MLINQIIWTSSKTRRPATMSINPDITVLLTPNSSLNVNACRKTPIFGGDRDIAVSVAIVIDKLLFEQLDRKSDKHSSVKAKPLSRLNPGHCAGTFHKWQFHGHTPFAFGHHTCCITVQQLFNLLPSTWRVHLLSEHATEASDPRQFGSSVNTAGALHACLRSWLASPNLLPRCLHRVYRVGNVASGNISEFLQSLERPS